MEDQFLHPDSSCKGKRFCMLLRFSLVLELLGSLWFESKSRVAQKARQSCQGNPRQAVG